jgi:hypothetical protein
MFYGQLVVLVEYKHQLMYISQSINYILLWSPRSPRTTVLVGLAARASQSVPAIPIVHSLLLQVLRRHCHRQTTG